MAHVRLVSILPSSGSQPCVAPCQIFPAVRTVARHRSCENHGHLNYLNFMYMNLRSIESRDTRPTTSTASTITLSTSTREPGVAQRVITNCHAVFPSVYEADDTGLHRYRISRTHGLVSSDCGKPPLKQWLAQCFPLLCAEDAMRKPILGLALAHLFVCDDSTT